MEGMEVETSLDVLSRAASLIETGSEVKQPLERLTCDTGSDSGYEDTFTPKPNTLLSKAMEHNGLQSQPMEVEEGKEQVVYRRRKMKCAGTQTLTGEQPAFPPRPVSAQLSSCVSPRSSFYEEIRPQQRTSVITSTHSQRRPHTIVGVPFGFSCPQPQIPHRKEVKSLPLTSGHVDPVVDEHFRRSLGAEYDDFNPPTGSVDDHFALSLGNKWYELRMNK